MKTKRLLAGALAAAMMLGTAAALPQGYSFFGSGIVAKAAIDSNGFTYTVNSKGAIIDGYSGSSTNVTFPSTAGGSSVYAVGNGNKLFGSSLRRSVTAITIPSGVTKIGDDAFSLCKALKTVSLPLTLTTIGDSAFSNCKALTTITIPSGVKTIGAEAFMNCSALTSVTIPDGVTTIGEEAFYDCINVKEITVPKSVTEIGAYAFGYRYVESNDNNDTVRIDDFVLKCYSNTAAYDYAVQYLSPDNYVLLDPGAHQHNYSKATVTKAATCTTKGQTTYTCACGESIVKTDIPSLGHDLVYSETVAPTQTEMGYDIYKCTRCTYTTKQNYTDVIKLGNLANATVTLPQSSYEYTGKKISPVPTVKLDGKTLSASTDYTVAYYNNLDVGSNAMVVVTGKGNYSGEKSATFSIVAGSASDISAANVTGINSSYSYTGSEIKPTPTVDLGGRTLTLNTDYTVAYSNNVNAGTATVTITGKGNYKNSKKVTFTITGGGTPTKTDISGATISGLTSKAYTGSAITQTPIVTYGGKALTQGTDYTVAYSNNTNVGTATVTITGKGNYTGSKSANFTITAVNLSGASVSGISNKTYTGSAITQTPAVTYSGKTLTLNTDYTVSYSNNTNAGTATVTITGKGNYTGSKSVTFTISAANISSATITGVNSSYTYTGSSITPVPTVKFGGKTLKVGTDYNVAYTANVNPGTATLTLTGKGNFTGTAKKTYTIVKQGTVVRTPGDVNGDGSVDVKDVTILKQYLAKWNVSINASNADVDGDGSVTVKDLTILKQYLAKWNVTLK